jgi:hypothetical protein
LERLLEQLDNEYFALAEASQEGLAHECDYQKTYAKARAVASVLGAFKPNPYDAACEAIYEASATTEEADDDLLSRIQGLLK